MLELREDILLTAGGEKLARKCIKYIPAVSVLPIDDQGRILLISHYRHGIGRTLWEIPGGMIDEGESAEQAAARELIEETGYRADRLIPLINFHPEPAMSNHRVFLFLGKGLFRVADQLHSESEILQAEFFTEREVAALLANGEIASSWTMMSLCLATNVFESITARHG